MVCWSRRIEIADHLSKPIIVKLSVSLMLCDSVSLASKPRVSCRQYSACFDVLPQIHVQHFQLTQLNLSRGSGYFSFYAHLVKSVLCNSASSFIYLQVEYRSVGIMGQQGSWILIDFGGDYPNKWKCVCFCFIAVMHCIVVSSICQRTLRI